MIHLDLLDGTSEWLTEEQLETKYPDIYQALRKPAPHVNVGRRLRYLRVKENMTMLELAKLLCIGLAEVSAIEAGRVEPTYDQIQVYQYLKFRKSAGSVPNGY